MPEILSYFHPILKEWFLEKFHSPTEIQEKSWDYISKAQHCLISSPTGSGKTLAAFFWAINTLIQNPSSKKTVRVLYISPLKALNSDVRRNLEDPLSDIEKFFAKRNTFFPEIKVAVRSSDTDYKERRSVIRNPPEIFITTPESLNILLSSKSSDLLFKSLDCVILDEIHSTIGTKRGTYLMSAIERLAIRYGEFQRIALSATIKPLQIAKDFVGGFLLRSQGQKIERIKRNVVVIQSEEEKKLQVSVSFPKISRDIQSIDSQWFKILASSFKKIIQKNRSTIFFTESRRLAEKITRAINEESEIEIAYSHHGSLAKELRRAVEEKMKSKDLPAIISTSSLELGIDIGSINEVVLTQTPYLISSALQRIGRSGHSVGQTSIGIFHPIHTHDLINAAVCAKSAIEGKIEDIQPIENPLDVLSQIILSMTLFESRNLDELYLEVKSCFDYRNLKRSEFDLVIEMLAGRFANTRIRELNPRLLVDTLGKTAKARENIAPILYLSGGVIPDRGYYQLRTLDTKAKIGELDEEFVWERSIGDIFPFGNKIWKIHKITHNEVEVQEIKHTNSLIPFWKAEERNRSYYFSEKIGEFLKIANENLKKESFKQVLENEYFFDENASNELISYLKDQAISTNADLPHKSHVLVEYLKDPLYKNDYQKVILHTFWGGKVNKPLAYSLSQIYYDLTGVTLEIYANNDCILLNLPSGVSFQEIFSFVKVENLNELLRKKLESTGLFGSRFRENAQRALLLTKPNFKDRVPLWFNRLRSKKLFESVSGFDNFPIVLETWRTCILDEFDIQSLEKILTKIQSKEIKMSEVITRSPSPFASEIIWRETNFLMYEGDSPNSKNKSSLSDELLKEVLGSSTLRPKFSTELILSLQEKLHRTKTSYSPDSPDELLLFLKDRLFIPLEEWETLLCAIERDQKKPRSDFLSQIHESICFIEKDHFKGIVSNEKKEKVLSAIKNKEPSFFKEWLQFYGPVKLEFLSSVFPLSKEDLNEILSELVSKGKCISDHFLEGEPSKDLQFIEIENLEILLRMKRKNSRVQFDSFPIEKLQLFISSIQGIAEKGDGLDDFHERLEKLIGYAEKPSLWESDIFPSRMKKYDPSWLDQSIRENELIFYGYAKNHLCFSFDSEFSIFKDLPQTHSEISNNNEISEFFTNNSGKFSFHEILNRTSTSQLQATKIIWDLFWKSKITNDHYSTIRTGILNKFQNEFDLKNIHYKKGFQRWKNLRTPEHWYRLTSNDPKKNNPLEKEEILKERVLQLFSRYGVLFKEILWNESQEFRWSSVIRTLLRMELSGEVIAGQFFSDISGLQFILASTFHSFEKNFPKEKIFWINACDPSSLCGIPHNALKYLPRRISSTHCVFQGEKLVLISRRNGKDIQILTSPLDPNISKFLEIFHDQINREVQPIRTITVEKINGIGWKKSEYKNIFLQQGFTEDRKFLTLRKSYS